MPKIVRHAIVHRGSLPNIPVWEFDWDANDMRMQYIICPRHPGMEYLTKDPRCRHLHIISFPDGTWTECPCKLADMVVDRSRLED
jgi:hypothetical protein